MVFLGIRSKIRHSQNRICMLFYVYDPDTGECYQQYAIQSEVFISSEQSHPWKPDFMSTIIVSILNKQIFTILMCMCFVCYSQAPEVYSFWSFQLLQLSDFIVNFSMLFSIDIFSFMWNETILETRSWLWNISKLVKALQGKLQCITSNEW